MKYLFFIRYVPALQRPRQLKLNFTNKIAIKILFLLILIFFETFIFCSLLLCCTIEH